MTYRFQKISDVGTKHPVMARLVLQTFDLVQASMLSEEERQKVAGIAMEIPPSLVECFQIREGIVTDLETAIASMRPDADNRVIHYDIIIRLNQKAENFLYQAKIFLRETHQIWAYFDGATFKDASDYVSWKEAKTPEFLTWAAKTYGEADNRYQLIAGSQDIFKRTIRLRNAVEHPGGNSGTLHIHNVYLNADNEMVGPSWNLDNDPPELMLPEMDTICDHLLGIAEDMFALNMIPRLPPMLGIIEIPPEERDPEQPKRLALGMKPEWAEKLRAAKPAGDQG